MRLSPCSIPGDMNKALAFLHVRACATMQCSLITNLCMFRAEAGPRAHGAAGLWPRGPRGQGSWQPLPRRVCDHASGRPRLHMDTLPAATHLLFLFGMHASSMCGCCLAVDMRNWCGHWAQTASLSSCHCMQILIARTACGSVCRYASDMCSMTLLWVILLFIDIDSSLAGDCRTCSKTCMFF